MSFICHPIHFQSTLDTHAVHHSKGRLCRMRVARRPSRARLSERRRRTHVPLSG
jgi:hypothetical protein